MQTYIQHLEYDRYWVVLRVLLFPCLSLDPSVTRLSPLLLPPFSPSWAIAVRAAGHSDFLEILSFLPEKYRLGMDTHISHSILGEVERCSSNRIHGIYRPWRLLVTGPLIDPEWSPLQAKLTCMAARVILFCPFGWRITWMEPVLEMISFKFSEWILWIMIFSDESPLRISLREANLFHPSFRCGQVPHDELHSQVVGKSKMASVYLNDFQVKENNSLTVRGLHKVSQSWIILFSIEEESFLSIC